MKCYVLHDLNSKEIFTSRHISFHEHIIPYNVHSPNGSMSWDYFPFNLPPSLNLPQSSYLVHATQTHITRTKTLMYLSKFLKSPQIYLDYIHLLIHMCICYQELGWSHKICKIMSSPPPNILNNHWKVRYIICLKSCIILISPILIVIIPYP